jgi:hypothetical protein
MTTQQNAQILSRRAVMPQKVVNLDHVGCYQNNFFIFSIERIAGRGDPQTQH